MFETIKRLYSKSGDSVIVSNAVKKGWITAEQYEEITGDKHTGNWVPYENQRQGGCPRTEVKSRENGWGIRSPLHVVQGTGKRRSILSE